MIVRSPLLRGVKHVKLSKRIRWSKLTAVLAVSMALVLGLGAAVAIADLATPAPLLAHDAETGNAVALSWTSAGGISPSYVVQFKPAAAGDAAYVTATTTTQTAVTVTDASGLLNGSNYVFRVKATELGQETGWAVSGVVTPTDKTDPTVTLQTIPVAPNGAGWYSVVPTYTVVGADPSGIATYQVAVDDTASPVAVANGGPVGATFETTAARIPAGIHTLYYRATDGADNTSEWASLQFKVDGSTPTVAAETTGTPGLAGWFVGASPVTTITPSAVGSAPIALVSYKWDDGEWTNEATSQPVAVPAPVGTHVLSWKCANAAGGVSAVASSSISFDGTSPSKPSTPTLTLAADGKVNIDWDDSSDAVSGLTTYTVSYSTTDAFSPEVTTIDTTSSAASFTGNDAQVYYVKVVAKDAAGNVSPASGVASIVADAGDPSLNVNPNGVAQWGTASQIVTITAGDTGSAGFANIRYKFVPQGSNEASFTWIVSLEPTVVVSTQEGVWTLMAEAYDGAGNITTAAPVFSSDWHAPISSFNIDQAAPNGLNSWYTSATVSISSVDVPGANGSDIDTLTINGVDYDAASHAITPSQGTNSFEFFAVDNAGHKEATKTASFKFDSVAPTATIDLGAYSGGNATTTPIMATINAGDQTSLVDGIEYQIRLRGADASETLAWTFVDSAEATFTVPEGNWTIYYRAVDNAGLKTANASVNAWYDVTAPVTTISSTVPAAPDGGAGTWKTVPVINFTTVDVDPASTFKFRWDETGTVESTSAASLTAPSAKGVHTLEYFSVDAAGNAEATKTATYNVDTDQPSSTGTFNVPATGDNGWYTAVPTFTIEATCANPATATTIFYAFDQQSEWTTYTAPFAVTTEGTHTIYHYAVDATGRVGAVYHNDYKLDTVDPTYGEISPAITTNNRPTLTISTIDGNSGPVAGAKFKLLMDGDGLGTYSNGVTSYQPVWPLAEGQNVIMVSGAKDAAGNVADSVYRFVTVDTIAPVTSADTAPEYTTTAIVNLSASDGNGSGVAQTYYKVDGGATVTSNVATVDTLGTHSLEFWSMDAAGNVETTKVVNFDVVAATYTITSNAGANGVITSSKTVTAGTDASFTIAANTGFHVADVLVDNVSVGAVGSYTFENVSANHTISATFARNDYEITASAGSNGSISDAGASYVLYGDNKTYGITAAAGYHVADVLVDGVSVGAVSSFTFSNVVDHHTIAASFAADVIVPSSYTVTASSGANGSLSIDGATTVASGSNLTVVVTPATGYHVANVTVDGVSKGSVGAFSFTNVSADHTISATFAADVFAISATAGSNGAVAGPAAPTYGSNAAFTITPVTGYHVVDVMVDRISVGAVSAYTFSNVKADHTISATFAINTYTLASSAGANGAISAAQTLNHGADSATFTITPALGYHVADVLVDGSSVGTVTVYKFSNVTANHTIAATFERTPPAVTSATIKSSAPSVTLGKYVTLSGKLNGTVAGTYKVRLEYRKSGSSTWNYVTYRSVSSTGAWSYRFKTASRGTRYYRVRYLGNFLNRACTSSSAKQVVK